MIAPETAGFGKPLNILFLMYTCI